MANTEFPYNIEFENGDIKDGTIHVDLTDWEEMCLDASAHVKPRHELVEDDKLDKIFQKVKQKIVEQMMGSLTENDKVGIQYPINLQLPMNKYNEISGLKGFYYFDIEDDFQINLLKPSDPNKAESDYFKEEVFVKGERWNGKSIRERFEKIIDPPYDSGVMCSKLPNNADGILKSLDCFMAPYKLMKATIGNKKYEKFEETSQEHPMDNICVAIGMVLTVIASKGSSERRNRNPYILMVNRSNSIRNKQLDVAVVEGLNISDVSNGIVFGTEGLNRVAKRALEEEIGINCDMLKNRELLHMPKRYYFGYDEEYRQWNFFGTVTVDCTIEEITREGCYFTKDKFESRGIIGIPFERKKLKYYLSHLNTGNETSESISLSKEKFAEPDGMWNTGWASIAFALFDYNDGRNHETRISSITSSMNGTKWKVRSSIDKIAHRVNAREYGINKTFGTLAGILFVITIIWCFFCNNMFLTKLNTKLSTFVTSGTCVLVVVLAHVKLIDWSDVIRFSNYGDIVNGQENYENQSIPETSVFRHVRLLDGNIAEKQRKVTITKEEVNETDVKIAVNRSCKIFYDGSDGGEAWTMKPKDPHDKDIENQNWVIQYSNNVSSKFRVVIAIVVHKMNIVVVQSGGKFMHPFDFEIGYSKINDAADCREYILNEIKKNPGINGNLGNIDESLTFKFLLQDDNEFVITGILDVDQLANGVICNAEELSLSIDLCNTTFADDYLKDDITRVVYEYARTEYLGYKMSDR